MTQTIFSGSFKSDRELTGPRQLRQALDQMCKQGHPVQIRVMTHEGRRFLRLKTPFAMCIVRHIA